MRKYKLGSFDEALYDGLSPQEREAWLHTEPGSYHSFHVERMGEHKYMWRDSREATFYVGTLADLTDALITMKLRKLDTRYEEHVTTLAILSQDEIDDLFSDL